MGRKVMTSGDLYRSNIKVKPEAARNQVSQNGMRWSDDVHKNRILVFRIARISLASKWLSGVNPKKFAVENLEQSTL